MRNRTATLVRVTVAAFACALSASSAWAKPAHKKALAEHFGPFLEKKLNDCRTCHLPDRDGAEVEKPHNPFGARLKAIGKELRKAGKTSDLAASLDAVAEEDSDGDGASNLIELLAGRFPGDSADKPGAEELDAAGKKVTAFRKFRDGYPWRPFQVVKRPPVPQVKNAAWVRSAIDNFISAEHEQRGLKPQPEAPRAILVRRVHLDLVGLPPTREELLAALGDPSPDWYEKVVDRLLADPRHGERWGRHWMDVWRYSDWYGYAGEIRNSQPFIWRWRDWIIESVNEDKGYDRMILEMLAGDELAPEDQSVVRATGYLARNFNTAGRDTWLQETVDHTFQGFLGLTIGCARCHDHMYDPLSQKEYYQVRAFFEPHQVRIDAVPGFLEKPRMSTGNGFSIHGDGFVRVFDADPKAPTYLHIRGETTMPDKTAPIAPGVPAALGGRLPEIAPVPLPRSVHDPEKREFVVRELLAAEEVKVRAIEEKAAKAAGDAKAGDAKALADLDVELAKAKLAVLRATLEAERFDDAGTIQSDAGKKAAAEAVTAQRRQAVLEARRSLLIAKKELADPKTNAAAVKKVAAIEKVLAKVQTEEKAPPGFAYVKRAIKTYPPQSTGRRTALAKWIADTENPLTARVAMNHLWMRHFGQGLVPQVSDFGRNGAPPTHPALLDWLAAEFMTGDAASPAWSMKRMHRLMVTSATYRMASTTDPADAAIDRDNLYCWRANSRRLEAEVVRDTLFHLCGSLDLTQGGPDIPFAKGMFVPRRSLYFNHAQEQMEFLKTFDTASVVECYQRPTSIAPQQALALANSDLAIQRARLTARRLSTGTEAEPFVNAAFETVLSRSPTADELSACVAFLRDQAKLYGPARSPAAVVDERAPSPDPNVRARENLVRILINHNDFMTIR